MSRSLAQRVDRGLKAREHRKLKLALAWKRRFSRRGRTIFISAMPKSGSTFLVNALSGCTGFQHQFLGQHQLNEQDLYPPNLLDAWSRDIVAHQHTRAHAPNLSLLDSFSIRPVILTRNLFDAAVSLTDHLERESLQTPIFNAPADFLERSREARLDMVLEFAMPWYVAFLAGWVDAARRESRDLFWLRYEELATDAATAVARVLTWYGIEVPADRVASATKSAAGDRSRLNRGISGRGAAELTEAQQARLIRLCGFYPDVDFSGVGIHIRAEPAT